MLHDVGVGGWIGHASLVPCHIVADENWDGTFLGQSESVLLSRISIYYCI